MRRQTSRQGGTRFRMLRAQFWTLAQSKYISEGTQKWTLLGSKVVPPGGPVFGPFILSDVLKLCKLICAQNVKLEATLTQTASVAGILNCTCLHQFQNRALERHRPYQRKKNPVSVKSFANLSWKGAREIVNLACGHSAGSAPGLEA